MSDSNSNQTDENNESDVIEEQSTTPMSQSASFTTAITAISKSPISIRNDSSESNDAASEAEIKEALNEFYRLKSKYETTFYEKFVKPIITTKSKSKREKRINYSKLPKPECVNCKRNVGSIFTIKSDTSDFKRYFTAKCGDLIDPCPFDIRLEIADKQRMDKETVIFNKELNDLKTEIVKGKNDMMFGYTIHE
jgi:hypothetical protein